jgi:hypothetical protein
MFHPCLESAMKPVVFLSGAVLCLSLACAHAEGLRKAIQFPKGKSAATLSSAVPQGFTDRYTLVANAGQTMTVGIRSEENNAVFTIYRPGYTVKTEDGVSVVAGATLEGAGEGEDAMKWNGKLPESGKYLIDVGATRGGATYKLSVTIK